MNPEILRRPYTVVSTPAALPERQRTLPARTPSHVTVRCSRCGSESLVTRPGVETLPGTLLAWLRGLSAAEVVLGLEVALGVMWLFAAVAFGLVVAK